LANSLPQLQFSQQHSRKQPIRPADDRYVDSDLRGVLEISEGDRPAEAFWPYKYLPVMFIDQTTKDGVVIPKGTIVSVVDVKTNPSGNVETSSLIPSESGQIGIGEDATTSALDFNRIVAEDSPWGYDTLVAGLLVPANGGADNSIPYSAVDETVGTLLADGFTYATASDTFTNPANVPIGIVTKDIYQDIRGKYLNYKKWDTQGVLCDHYVKVPFMDSAQLASEDTSTSTTVYYNVWRNHAFLYKYTGTTLYSGQFVQSDLNGKFRPQVSSTRTEQTVGKVLLYDSRFPKGALDRVATYPGSGAQGTDTGGLPQPLYTFAKAALTITLGSTPTQTVVLDSVREGTFGMAHIQLSVA